MSCRSVFCCLSNNYMISFKSSKCNIISQTQYDSEIRRICSCISSFPCPFCGSCSLVFYGRYPRRICVPDCPEFIIIRVQRVFCTHSTATEHMHFFLICGYLVLRFLFHLFQLLLLFLIISSLLSRTPSIL